jgi:Polyketide cyclase / dehydrase and lipid transport
LIRALFAAVLASDPVAIPEEGFGPWFVEREVAVSRTRAAGETPWIRAVAELAVPADAVYAAVTDYARYRELFDPAVSRADVLETTGNSARIHFVWPYPFPFRRRDAIVEYRGERRDNGALVVTWGDAARAGDPGEGVRIVRVAGETRIEPRGAGRCRVTYTYLGDLGGKFPRALEDKAWRHEPLGYFYALRRRLGLAIPPK